MKRLLTIFFLLFFAFSFAQEDVVNTSERIISFHSDILVNSDASIQVSEKIRVYASGNAMKRGIFRTLPLSRNLNDREQSVDYDNISVKKNGEVEDFHTETKNDNLIIYVGKKEVFLAPDYYDYEINYTTKNTIGFFDKYDEFYWNVNGLNWDFNTEKVSANIKLPSGASILQNSCYTGAYGSTSQNCTSNKISDTEISYSAENLLGNEGLSVAIGFKKGIILPPPPPTTLEKYGILAVGFLFLSGLFAYFFKSWDEYGRDFDNPTVYPQFNPPGNFSPASFGYLKKQNFSTSFVTASVVNLAIKGYLKITESVESNLLGLFKSTKYTLTQTKDSDNDLPKEEQNILNNLFSENSKSLTLGTKYNSTIEKMVKDVKSSLNFQHDDFLKTGNNQKLLIIPSIVIIALYAIGLVISNFINPDSGKIALGAFFFVFLMVVFFILQYFGKFKIAFKIFWIVPAFFMFIASIGIYMGLESANDQNFNYCYLFLMVAFSGLIIYSYFIRQPSKELLQQRSLIDGFEMYLGAAENQLLKFHNPPQMTPEIFEKYLPYAMVLGLDNIWGKKFEKMLENMKTPYQNNWYVGNSFHNASFVNAFSSSMTSSLSSASTPPSSSSSGSGGGGFSGGGGGGGGGGGW